MRISDWSSDVCASDLAGVGRAWRAVFERDARRLAPLQSAAQRTAGQARVGRDLSIAPAGLAREPGHARAPRLVARRLLAGHRSPGPPPSADGQALLRRMAGPVACRLCRWRPKGALGPREGTG